MNNRGEEFRALHARAEVFVIPNPWSIGTAKLLESLGFEALATTSSGHAYSLGRPDGMRAVNREEALGHAADIAAATAVPVSADLERGYGDDPATVAETVRLAGEAGLAGCSIEDSTGDPTAPIYEYGLAVERIAAAVATARAVPGDFMLTARSENYLHGRPELSDTVRRLQAFQEAGADVLYAPGLSDIEDVARLVAAVDRPVNVLARPQWTVDELQEAGVSRISIGGAMAIAAYGAVFNAAQEILNIGSFGYTRDIPHELDLGELFGET